MEEKQTIVVLDQNGKETEAEVIAMFKIEELGKKYMLYTLNEVDENNMVKIYASTVIERDGMFSLEAIETDEEWTILKDIMKKMAQDEQA